jgi:hypothetical protein
MVIAPTLLNMLKFAIRKYVVVMAMVFGVSLLAVCVASANTIAFDTDPVSIVQVGAGSEFTPFGESLIGLGMPGLESLLSPLRYKVCQR